MYHSMTIIPDGEDIYNASGKLNGINTWDDWHLMPASRPLIVPPGIRTEYIEIPGMDYIIDLSDYFNDRVIYTARGGSLEFYVMNGYGSWANRYSEIMNYLHGKKFKLILEDDPGWYYTGRMSVNQWQSVKDWSRITLDYNFEPFKFRTTTTGDNWLWDPFNFEVDVIQSSKYNNVVLTSDLPRHMVVDFVVAKPVTPAFSFLITNLNPGYATLSVGAIDENGIVVNTSINSYDLSSLALNTWHTRSLDTCVLTDKTYRLMAQLDETESEWHSMDPTIVRLTFFHRETKL